MLFHHRFLKCTSIHWVILLLPYCGYGSKRIAWQIVWLFVKWSRIGMQHLLCNPYPHQIKFQSMMEKGSLFLPFAALWSTDSDVQCATRKSNKNQAFHVEIVRHQHPNFWPHLVNKIVFTIVAACNCLFPPTFPFAWFMWTSIHTFYAIKCRTTNLLFMVSCLSKQPCFFPTPLMLRRLCWHWWYRSSCGLNSSYLQFRQETTAEEFIQ